MAESAAAAAAIKAWDTGISGLSELVKRIDLVEDNREKLPEWLEMCKNALKAIHKLDEHTLFHEIPACDEEMKDRIREHKEKLGNQRKKMEKLENKVKRARCWKRVKKMRKQMEECRTLVNEFRDYYDGSVRPALERTTKAKVQTTILETIQEEPADVISSEPDSYVKRILVPTNPPRLTLNYNTTDTCEGRLKAEIVSSQSSIIGVMAVGLGGVGKTCALRGLANDEDIREKFPDGILFIQLGNDSALSDMIMEIAGIVEKTGGPQLARTIRAQETVEQSSEKAGQWFESRKCLFLVDDIWEVNGITPQELRNMGTMLSEGSLLVFTSRSKGFLDGIDREVLFKEREAQGELAQLMLMNHANSNYSELSSGDKEAVKGILEICQGLPLALGIAGATVWKSYCRESVSSKDAWRDYYHDLQSKEESIVTSRDRLYGPLTRIVVRSLKVLDSDSSRKRLAEMFRGFCVLQKQQSVGGQMLRKLWGLEDLRQTREIAELFESVSLVRMHRKRENEFSIQLHDLVLEIANEMASGNEKIEWFKKLLENYSLSERSGTAAATEISATDRVPFTSWWKLEDDGFIHDNLCHILHEAEETSELMWLLERAQWVVMRLQSSGIRGMERDLDFGIQVADKNGTENAEQIHYLRLIGSAARMSWCRIVENAYEAWFQMCGRTVWYAEQCVRTRRFVSEIQEHAPRPFVRPSVGFLDEAGGPRLDSIFIGTCRCILSLWHGDDMIRILCLDRDGKAFVTEYDRTFGTTKAHMLSSVGVDKDSSGDVERHSASSDTRSMVEECIGGEFSNNQKRLVTGYRSRELIVWDVDRGYKVDAYRECSRRVNCVAISGDGKIVAYGLVGSLWIWDTSLQDDTENPFEALEEQGGFEDVDVSFDGKRVVICVKGLPHRAGGDIHLWDSDVGGAMAVPPGMQTGDMSSATISRDGKRMVSGSLDGTIRIWNVGSTAGAVRSMRGHRKRVWHVALNADGTRIVSASGDKTACVWDVETGAMIGQALEVDYITMSISPDGKQVAKWFNNLGGIVQVFDPEKMSASLRPERFTGRVECVAYDGHGTRVVSGCDDGRVCVWDRTNGQLIADAHERHAGAVKCVAVSADGGRIVSGGTDGVRVWDATCDAVAPPLDEVGGKQLGGISSVAVNNDGTRVLFSCRDGVFVWDVGSGDVTTVTRDEGHSHVAMSCDGARVAFTSGDDYNNEVTVWDVHARQAVASPLTGHTNMIMDVVFSGDGTRVLSGSEDGTVRVWDANSGTAIGNPLVHHSPVVHVQSNVDGSCVVSHDRRGYGRMWHVGRGECVITSADAEWISTVHRHGLVPYSTSPKFLWLWNIKRCAGTDTEKLLASADTRVVLVGDLYFSERHGAKFWPFATIVK